MKKKKQVVSHYDYKMALIETSVFTYANSLSTPSHHPWHSLFFSRDHLRSGIICTPGIVCGPVQNARPVEKEVQLQTKRKNTSTGLDLNIRFFYITDKIKIAN